MIVSRFRKDLLSYCDCRGFIFTIERNSQGDLFCRTLKTFDLVCTLFLPMNFRYSRARCFSLPLYRLSYTCDLFSCLFSCWWNCDIFCSLSCVEVLFLLHSEELQRLYQFCKVCSESIFYDCFSRHLGLDCLYYWKRRKLFLIVFVGVARWDR